MKFWLFICPKYGKNIKFTSSQIKHVNVCKISIILLSCKLSKPLVILEYNIINFLNWSSDNNKENIGLDTSNNNNKKMRPGSVDITSNDNKDINHQKSTTLE